jgi:hypothetical protein
MVNHANHEQRDRAAPCPPGLECPYPKRRRRGECPRDRRRLARLGSGHQDPELGGRRPPSRLARPLRHGQGLSSGTTSSPATTSCCDFTRFVFRQAARFEAAAIRHLRDRVLAIIFEDAFRRFGPVLIDPGPTLITIARSPSDIRSLEKARATVEAMRAGVPVIHRVSCGTPSTGSTARPTSSSGATSWPGSSSTTGRSPASRGRGGRRPISWVAGDGERSRARSAAAPTPSSGSAPSPRTARWPGAVSHGLASGHRSRLNSGMQAAVS